MFWQSWWWWLKKGKTGETASLSPRAFRAGGWPPSLFSRPPLCHTNFMHPRHALACTGRPARPQCAPRRARPAPRLAATPAQRELQAARSPAKATDPEPIPLPSWASAAGIAAPSVRVAWFNGVRGLQATSPIAADAPVVTLPVDAALLVRPGAACPVGEGYATREYWKRAAWFARMALLLVRARRAADGTETVEPVPAVHAAYAADLPPPGGDAIDTPVAWSADEIAALHYRPLIDDVIAQQKSWADAYASYKNDVPTSTVTRAEWDWALSCVRSRAFSGPYAGPPLKARAGLAVALVAAAAASVLIGHAPLDSVINGALAAALFQVLYDVSLSSKIKWHAMAPVVDLANHSGTAVSDMQYAYFRDAFVLTVGAPVPAGDQVFISYGAQGNDSLLQWYGFVEAPNPHDAYRLAWRPAGQGGQVTTVLTRSGADEASVTAIQDAMGASTTKAAALTALLAAVDAEAAAWPGTADSDAATAADPATPRRAATAAAFRREKRAVLAAARRAVAKAVSKAERV